jgi:hypothetical protein
MGFDFRRVAVVADTTGFAQAGVPSRLRWRDRGTRVLRPTLAGERRLFAAVTSSPPTRLISRQRTANGACARGWPPSHYNVGSLCAGSNSKDSNAPAAAIANEAHARAQTQLRSPAPG